MNCMGNLSRLIILLIVLSTCKYLQDFDRIMKNRKTMKHVKASFSIFIYDIIIFIDN